MDYILYLIGQVQWLFWALAIALFFYGLAKFILHADNVKEHEEGRNLMVWGLISIFILTTLWAIVNFLLIGSLGLYPVDFPNFVDKNGVFRGN